MIYVTGDTHGSLDRFAGFHAPKLKKEDYLIVCGDFGFLWDQSPPEKKALGALSKKKFTTLFIEGTHDNLDLIERYPKEEWKGGAVRKIAERVYHLCRGEIFDLDGVSLFAMGGGESPDSDARVPGVSWWPGELPTPGEIDAARKRLDAAGRRVDVIVTHSPSSRELGLLGEEKRVSILGEFFDEIARTVLYQKWFFGSMHLDKAISPKSTAVFQQVIKVELK